MKQDQINEMKALKDLQYQSICQLRKRLGFWDDLVLTIQTKRDRIKRQHQLTVQAYQQTDLNLALLDGRLTELKPRQCLSKTRSTQPNSVELQAKKIMAKLGNTCLTEAQLSAILTDALANL
jgi:hypothetical protein